MTTPFVGEISIVGFNFATRGWAQCNGQLLPIAQNSALFSLLGNQFGGDGQTTFALPDLRSRAPMSQGNGTGLTPRLMGQSSGSEGVTLLQGKIPLHTHAMTASGARADRANPRGSNLAVAADDTYATDAPLTSVLASASIGTTGSDVSHNNMQPFLTLNFLIALAGVYPSRP